MIWRIPLPPLLCRNLRLLTLSVIGVLPVTHGGQIDIQLAFDVETPTEVRAAAEAAAAKWESWLKTARAESTALKFEVLWINRPQNVNPSAVASAGCSWYGHSADLALPSTLYLALGHPKAVAPEAADATITIYRESQNDFLNHPYYAEGVLLHEIGHALGFAPSYHDTLLGYRWGVNTANGGTFLTPYDRALEDGEGRSPDVGWSAFDVESQVRFKGFRSSHVYPGGVPIQSGAPFIQGSSLSHVVLDAMMRMDANPYQGLHNSEAAILEDIGWGIQHPTNLHANSILAYNIDGVEQPAHWNQGQQWGGLPPHPTTDVYLEGGDTDFTLEISEGRGEARNISIAGTTTSVPHLLVSTILQADGDIAIATDAAATGLMTLQGETHIAGGLKIGGSLNGDGQFACSGSFLDVGQALEIGANGSFFMEGSLVRVRTLDQSAGSMILNGGRFELRSALLNGGTCTMDGTSVGKSGPDPMMLGIAGGTFVIRNGVALEGGVELAGGRIELEGQLACETGCLLEGGTLSASGEGNSIAAGPSAGGILAWTGTSIVGVGANAYLGLHSAQVTISGGERLVSDLELVVTGQTQMSAGNIEIRNSLMELNSGLAMHGGSFELNGSSMAINGEFPMSGGAFALADSSLQVNGSSAVSGDVHLAEASVLELNGDLTISNGELLADAGSSLTLNGDCFKSGPGLAVIHAPLLLNGDIEVSGGRLTVSGPTQQNGICIIEAGSILAAGDGFHPSRVEGEGTMIALEEYHNDSSLVLGNGSRFEAATFVQSATGTLSGSGTLIGSATFGGRVAPGMSPGTLTIAGTANLTPTSALAMELGKPGEPQDLLRIIDPNPADDQTGGHLVLNGTLEITALLGFREGIYPIATYEGELEDRGMEITHLPDGYTAFLMAGNGRVTLHVSALDFGTWAQGFGLLGDDALPDATPFLDGVPNLLKFAFNLAGDRTASAPLDPGNIPGLPEISVVYESEGILRLRMEYVRRKNSGLNYQGKTSQDLASFTPITGVVSIEPIDPAWERVVVLESSELGSAGQRFGTVEVTLSDP